MNTNIELKIEYTKIRSLTNKVNEILYFSFNFLNLSIDFSMNEACLKIENRKKIKSHSGP